MTMGRRVGAVGVAVLLAAGCGDNGGGTMSGSNSDSATESATAATEPTGGLTEASGSNSMSATEGAEGGMSESISGTTAAEGGMSESLSNGGETTPDSISGSGSTGDESGMISGGGETSASTGGTSTGEAPIVCADIDNQQDCLDAGCMAINGQHFGGDEANACLEATEFLACSDPIGCDDVISTFCDGNEVYQLPSSCSPPGWEPCNPPPDAGMNGYPDCP